jgi:excisionase family DNA binding protein
MQHSVPIACRLDMARSPKETPQTGSLRDLTAYLISVTEASRFSGLSISMIRLLLARGDIEGVKVGRNWSTTREAVQKYLAQERRPGPKPGKKRPQRP